MEEAITQLKAKGRLRPWNDPGPGRRRLEITCKEKGVVVWHKAGPSNIVLGLYRKFLETRKGREFVMGLGCRSQVSVEKEP